MSEAADAADAAIYQALAPTIFEDMADMEFWRAGVLAFVRNGANPMSAMDRADELLRGSFERIPRKGLTR